MFWDDEYKTNERIWGERPGELAIAAVKYLQKCGLNKITIIKKIFEKKK